MGVKNTFLYQGIRKAYFGLKNLPYNIKKSRDTHSLKKYKNIHKGEVCFVVGNGPSMTVEDLDKIHELGVTTFACNKIFLVFDETEWRPTYFSVSDTKIISEIEFDKIQIPLKNMFFRREFKPELNNGNYYEVLDHKWLTSDKFSTDAFKGIYSRETIIIELLQLAYYMGFSKVYIIGVDFSYNMQSVDTNNLTFVSGGNNYFIKGYEKPGEVLNLGNEQSNILGFMATRKAFEDNGREIYNATRGGKLEVFERKNLDDVFQEIEEGLK